MPGPAPPHASHGQCTIRHGRIRRVSGALPDPGSSLSGKAAGPVWPNNAQPADPIRSRHWPADPRNLGPPVNSPPRIDSAPIGCVRSNGIGGDGVREGTQRRQSIAVRCPVSTYPPQGRASCPAFNAPPRSSAQSTAAHALRSTGCLAQRFFCVLPPATGEGRGLAEAVLTTDEGVLILSRRFASRPHRLVD